MTTFFRKSGPGFEYLVTDLAWKHLADVTNQASYAAKSTSHFTTYTEFGVRAQSEDIITLGVVQKNEHLVSDISKSVSLALLLREHNLTTSKVHDVNIETEHAHHVDLHIVSIQNDTWYLAAYQDNRIVLDTTISGLESKDAHSITEALESKQSLSDIIAKLANILSDLFLDTSEQYIADVTLWDIEESKFINVFEGAITSLVHDGYALALNSTSSQTGVFSNLLHQGNIPKQVYLSNVRRFTNRRSGIKPKAVVGALILASSVALWMSNRDSGIDSTEDDALFSNVPVVQTAVTKNTNLNNEEKNADTSDSDAMLFKDAISQEMEWVESYVRSSGHKSTTILKSTIGSLPASTAGYALNKVMFVRKSKLGSPSPTEVINSEYIREDESALLVSFTTQFDYVQSFLDGEKANVVHTLPDSKLDKPFDAVFAHFVPENLISTLQSFKYNGLIDNWTLTSAILEKRPIPLSTEALRSIQRYMRSNTLTENDYISDIREYKLVITSKHLQSLGPIEEIVSTYQNAVLVKLVYSHSNSQLVTEISIYDAKQ
ncbi:MULTISPECIES: hypothetical protein [Vibrio]|uniref:hypothetical protein n=1 Tax=Vibrio TaxID=662 RepID=UPI002075B682|nr:MULTISPECIES: hypothetical protein [Vibrio]USD35495.1 hypothetical protein J8Z27_23025 [Vibrio sp. SCSIO 43186]USD72619.1 hypothetical protein J4N41_23030 [Vibrio sp. SCSIO 43139]USD99010.1 hypothetical protein CTT30_23340 [Vibrio coralliilyticus]